MKSFVDHTAITVKDIDWCIHFFGEVCGMEVTRRKEIDGELKQVWLAGGLQFVAAPEDWQSGQPHHIGLVVENLDDTRAKMLTYPGVESIPGRPAKWLRLPDGLVLELFDAQPGAIERMLDIDLKVIPK